MKLTYQSFSLHCIEIKIIDIKSIYKLFTILIRVYIKQFSIEQIN